MLTACRPDPPESVPLPTKVCIRTSHHLNAVPGTTVYLKYFAETFPGYDKLPDYYDASFKTGADGRGCIESVPEGKHWLVALGYDSIYHLQQVYGSLPIEISLREKPVIDTTIYLSE